MTTFDSDKFEEVVKKSKKKNRKKSILTMVLSVVLSIIMVFAILLGIFFIPVFFVWIRSIFKYKPKNTHIQEHKS